MKPRTVPASVAGASGVWLLIDITIARVGYAGTPEDAVTWFEWFQAVLSAIPLPAIVLLVMASTAVSIRPDLLDYVAPLSKRLGGLISLPDAARIAYEETRYADNFVEGDGAARLRHQAGMLTLEAREGKVVLWGKPAPSSKYEAIPADRVSDIDSYLSTDLLTMRVSISRRHPDYEDLAIKRADLKKHIARLRENPRNQPRRGRSW